MTLDRNDISFFLICKIAKSSNGFKTHKNYFLIKLVNCVKIFFLNFCENHVFAICISITNSSLSLRNLLKDCETSIASANTQAHIKVCSNSSEFSELFDK